MIVDYKNILNEFDKIERKHFSEQNIYNALVKIKNKNTNFELESEILAFQFTEDYENIYKPWNTYFGPLFYRHYQDGTIIEEVPEINSITLEMINYWEQRGKESANPILVARYYGLVWDFKRKISNSKLDHKIAESWIQAIIKISVEDYLQYYFGCFIKLKKALSLSIELQNKDLIDNCKKAIIDYENKVAVINDPKSWGHIYNLLVGQKKITLSEQEEKEIINNLEEKLNILLSANDINLWTIEAIIIMLGNYYKRKSEYEAVKKIVTNYNKGLQKLISYVKLTALQKNNYLDKIHQLYRKFDLHKEAEEILKKIRSAGIELGSELNQIEYSFKITQKQIQECIDPLIEEEIEKTLINIAKAYIPQKQYAKQAIFKHSKENPLEYLIGHTLLDEKGRIINKIGTEFEDHIFKFISESLMLDFAFLQITIKKAMDKFKLTTADIIKVIVKNPFIEHGRLPIIEKGIDNYFNKDYIIFIHILIPQIEEIVRNIISSNGGNIMKENKSGGYDLKTFSHLLEDNIIKTKLGEDLTNYFKILLTDSRGWNLRNKVCHGIADLNTFSMDKADRIFHTLLCLGLIEN